MPARKKGQFRVRDGLALLPDEGLNGLADHPGNRHVVLTGKSTELLIVPFVQADGETGFFAISSRATHRMVFIAPLYCSLQESVVAKRGRPLSFKPGRPGFGDLIFVLIEVLGIFRQFDPV